MNTVIKEVYLDFMDENGYDEPDQRTVIEAEALSSFLNSLRGARTLTVCPYFLQVIQDCRNPFSLLRPMETQHLVLRTKLNVVEYKGIRLILNGCPKLERLTIDYLGRNIFSNGVTYGNVHRRTFWLQKRAYLPNTLKVVVVRNFTGGKNELYVLKFLIGSGRGRRPGPVLERVELYIDNEMHENKMMVAISKAEMLQTTSGDVQVVVHYT